MGLHPTGRTWTRGLASASRDVMDDPNGFKDYLPAVRVRAAS
jgi:hypothetical protein